MADCKKEHCIASPYKSSKYCVLHNKKNKYQEDKRSGILNDFHAALINLILSKVFTKHGETQSANKSLLVTFLKGNSSGFPIELDFINFFEIIFPARDSRDLYDYEKVLKKYKQIHFDNCKFHANSISLDGTQVFFQDCVFINCWSLYNYSILKNDNSIIYQDCIFEDDVSSWIKDDRTKTNYTERQFGGCIFAKSLTLENMIADKQIFCDYEYTQEGEENKKMIGTLIKIEKCVFSDWFTFSNYDIKRVIIIDSIFNKFEFKYNNVQTLEIKNCNFDKISDFFSTSVKSLFLFKSIFNKFTGFECCRFGEKSSNKKEHLAHFQFVTFLDFVNFRNTVFDSGVDLRSINTIQPANFYNCQINSNTTDRESYRIIKNSFELQGNKLDANKFFSLEMRQHREELRGVTGKWQEKLVFHLNHFISDFGQSYVKPICFILLLSMLYEGIEYAYINNWLYKIYPLANEYISKGPDLFNNLAKNVFPFKQVLTKGMESVSLVFSVFYSILVWQTIVAVKRHTKR